MKEAERIGAKYVLAQDPDADRFAAAEMGSVNTPDSFIYAKQAHTGVRSDGKWVAITGDQLGAIFAARCLEMYKVSGKPVGR